MSKVVICGVNTATLPRITEEQGVELLKRIKLGDEFAREKFIVANMRLVLSIIKRFWMKNKSSDDVFQAGCIGLIKAIDNFDLSVGVKFSTYAVPMIIGEIKRFLRDDGEIKVSRIIKYNAYKISKFIEVFQSKNGREPTVEEISSALDISAEDVVIALDSNKITVSLYETVDDGQDKSQSLIEKIPSPENEEEKVERLYVKQLLKTLNEREQQIIVLRYFRDKTQGEVARLLGVSQVQVSRLENKILKKLKDVAK